MKGSLISSTQPKKTIALIILGLEMSWVKKDIRCSGTYGRIWLLFNQKELEILLLPFVGEDITGVKDEAVDFRGLVLLEPEDSKSSADKVVASSSSFSSQHRL